MQFSVSKLLLATTGFCCSLAFFSFVGFYPWVSALVSVLIGLILLVASREHIGGIAQVCSLCLVGTILGAMLAPPAGEAVGIMFAIAGCAGGAMLTLIWRHSTGYSRGRPSEEET